MMGQIHELSIRTLMFFMNVATIGRVFERWTAPFAGRFRPFRALGAA
ncbi:MAG: hypothetical protein ABI378_08595 [Chitinophagaceae bacterium]